MNSRKDELNGYFEERYLDLRFEEQLPSFYCPENVVEFREKLRILLLEIYKDFKFNVLAITCFTSFTFLNCIEVSWMIKHYINPDCQIIVGGVHPTTYPEDFFAENIPKYFGNQYPKKSTPFDAICIDEGEKAFFSFIKNLISGKWKYRKNLQQNPIILERELMNDLNEIPLIDLSLFKKYRHIFEKKGEFYINFSRGCLYTCKFCSSSIDSRMESYRKVRIKSVEKCIAELKIILNTGWLSNLKKVMIDDAVFFPKRSQREKFFKELDKIYREYDDIPFQLFIHDRMEICSIKDLERYKKYNIVPGFGLETGSPTLLCRLGKFLGKNNNLNNATKYLKLAEDLIKKANELDTPIVFLCMAVCPGTDRETIRQSRHFFLDKRYPNGKDNSLSLIERYKVNLQIQKFGLLPGNTFYLKGEELFPGSKYYFKEWYKIFDKEQGLYSAIFKPSADISFPKAMDYFIDFLKSLYKSQLRLKNDFYTLAELMYHIKLYSRMLEIYQNKDRDEKNE
ncbi:MAG: hypothetical protein EU542_09295 [Promethearchaeota archaeon]|nr:MAG: hypothetical protein EU542_09295 [Candidatus Lokiarchaeota archaeon]